MENLVHVQVDTFDRITRAKANFKKSPKDRINKHYVQVRIDTLDQLWFKFNDTHNEILKGTLDRDMSYFKDNMYELVEELYVDYKTDLKCVLESLQSPSNSKLNTSAQILTDNSNIKLPRIVIPTFSGQYSDWTTFRDLFVSLVHNNMHLDSVQKLHYLKGYLSGEAEQLIRQIPISDLNYDRCWSLLNSRYNNKRFLCHAILKRLLSQRCIVNESANMLKGLLDTTTDCLCALTNIGVDVGWIYSWDILVIHLLTLKLDVDSRKEWEMFISNTNDLDTLPKFSQFKEFLTRRYRALEFLEPKSSGINKPTNVQTNIGNKPRVFYSSQSQCEFCNEHHKLSNCKKFAREDVSSRRKFIEQNGLCFNCFGHHAAKMCQSLGYCRVCRRKHHSMLHPENDNEGSGGSGDLSYSTDKAAKSNKVFISTSEEDGDDPETHETSNLEDNEAVVSCYSSDQFPVHKQVLLATALINVESNVGERHMIRALLDQGSQASFVTEAVVQFLGLKRIPIQGRVSGLEGNENVKVKYAVQIKICPRFDSPTEIIIHAYVLKSITSFLPSKKMLELDWLNSTKILLADPQYHTPNKIDMLLGAEVYGQVIKNGIKRGSKESAVAQNTSLGWIISGQVSQSRNDNIVAMCTCTSVESDDYLKIFWEQEADPKAQQRILIHEEEECERFFAETVSRDIQGRYIVRLPFKKDVDLEFEGSKRIAGRRLQSLYTRFGKDEYLKEEYARVIQEYKSMGHMEEIPADEQNKKCFYLPHHAVVKKDRDTTKVRVVFDASCKDKNGNSLNSALMIGPKLQPELRHLLMRWRSHPVCLAADIVKMYRQIKVSRQDADFQRLLWDKQWNNLETDKRNNEMEEKSKLHIQEYRLLRVTFGTASAPYLAVKALQQLAFDECKPYSGTSERIIKDFYMDDLLSGCQTVEEGIHIYRNMKMVLKKGGFELQKWMTNNDELLKILKKEEDGEIIGEGVNLKTDEVVKLLGLIWNRCTDEFQYKVSLPQQTAPVTKRKVISDISRLYDPLGWLSPCIITAKTFIQKLWLTGINWDEELPDQILQEWITYRKNLESLSDFKLPRWIKTKSDDDLVELHGFADASSIAYSAVVYLRVVDSTGKVYVSLITCKTKVAPIKQISIPRMELCAATLLSKLLKEVSEVLQIEKSKIHAWSDSEVVLAWLKGHPSRWQTFVGNRVATILCTLDSNQWSHISSNQNPADCASRGISPSALLKHVLWLQGPSIIHEKVIRYPKQKIEETQLEIKKVHFTDIDCFIWDKYSSLTKLLRVVAYCRRVLGLINRGNSRPFQRYLTARELSEATDCCIKKCQQEHFGSELRILKNKEPSKIKGPLKPLNPFIDESGLLRVGGRLDSSQLSVNQKHPILIPKKSSLTNLLIADAHLKTLHGGPQHMLTFLQAKYWILGAKLLVRAFVRKCITCFKHKAKTTVPIMGQLPAVRVTPTHPFKCSGVDYAAQWIDAIQAMGHRLLKQTSAEF